MADGEVTLWTWGDIYACSCSEKQYRHVHCPCSECNGRAIDRSTELRHWHQAKLLTDPETGLAVDARDSTDTESEVDSLESYASEDASDMETDGEDHLQHVQVSYASEREQEIETDEEVFFKTRVKWSACQGGVNKSCAKTCTDSCPWCPKN